MLLIMDIEGILIDLLYLMIKQPFKLFFYNIKGYN
jgi:hypothetical protein